MCHAVISRQGGDAGIYKHHPFFALSLGLNAGDLLQQVRHVAGSRRNGAVVLKVHAAREFRIQ